MPEHDSLTGSPQADVLCLLLLSVFVSFWGITSGPGLSDHEGIVALGARSMVQGGDWLIPRVGNEDFVRKPPLAFWLTAVASKIVDAPNADPVVSRTAARLPSALACVLTAMVVYALGRSMFGHRAGIVCGAVFAVSGGAMFFSHNAQVEMVLAFFCTCAFAFFWWGTEGKSTFRHFDTSTSDGRRASRPGLFLMLFYVSCALAMLAKAPLPLAVVGLPLAVWWFFVVPIGKFDSGAKDHGSAGTRTRAMPFSGSEVSGSEISNLKSQIRSAGASPSRAAILAAQGRRFLRLWLVPGTLLFLLIFLPWPIYVYRHVPHADDLWRIEFFDRYTGDLGGKDRAFWYYMPIMLAYVFPFTLSLPEALASPFLAAYRDRRKPLLFLLTWAVVQLVFLSTSHFKRPHYLVASLPAYALLLGPAVDRLFLAARTMPRRGVLLATGGIVLLVIAGGVAAGVAWGAEHAETMRGFRPAIVVLAAGLVVTCVAFVRRSRRVALPTLLATAALTFAFSWDQIGRAGMMDARAEQMIKELRERSIGPDDRITWTIGRADSRLEYYMNLNINQLYTSLELAPLRDGRSSIPQELLLKGIARVKERLGSDQEEYFIIKGKYWDLITGTMDLEAREVCRVVGEFGDPKDDWVLITNPWNEVSE